MMHHMRKASVRDLRYQFSKIEQLLNEGQEIELTKRGRVIARLVPVGPSAPQSRPDFLARLKRIYGDKMLKPSGAELIAQERNRY